MFGICNPDDVKMLTRVKPGFTHALKTQWNQFVLATSKQIQPISFSCAANFATLLN